MDPTTLAIDPAWVQGMPALVLGVVLGWFLARSLGSHRKLLRREQGLRGQEGDEHDGEKSTMHNGIHAV